MHAPCKNVDQKQPSDAAWTLFNNFLSECMPLPLSSGSSRAMQYTNVFKITARKNDAYLFFPIAECGICFYKYVNLLYLLDQLQM